MKRWRGEGAGDTERKKKVERRGGGLLLADLRSVGIQHRGVEVYVGRVVDDVQRTGHSGYQLLIRFGEIVVADNFLSLRHVIAFFFGIMSR